MGTYAVSYNAAQHHYHSLSQSYPKDYDSTTGTAQQQGVSVHFRAEA